MADLDKLETARYENSLTTNWRKRVRVERTGDRDSCRPPVLKITQGVLIRSENSLFYLIRQPLPRFVF